VLRRNGEDGSGGIDGYVNGGARYGEGGYEYGDGGGDGSPLVEIINQTFEECVTASLAATPSPRTASWRGSGVSGGTPRGLASLAQGLAQGLASDSAQYGASLAQGLAQGLASDSAQYGAMAQFDGVRATDSAVSSASSRLVQTLGLHEVTETVPSAGGLVHEESLGMYETPVRQLWNAYRDKVPLGSYLHYR
jgi:hypothetical protein